MPRIRLRAISGNIRRGIELTPSLPSRVCGAHDFGVGIAEISCTYEIPESTIRSTLKFDPIRIDNETPPRSGAPIRVSTYIERKILRFVRTIPKTEHVVTQREYDTSLSKATLYRLLKKHGITN